MPLQFSQNVFQEQGFVDSCQAHTRMICMLSFSFIVGSKTVLAAALLLFFDLALLQNS